MKMKTFAQSVICMVDLPLIHFVFICTVYRLIACKLQ